MMLSINDVVDPLNGVPREIDNDDTNLTTLQTKTTVNMNKICFASSFFQQRKDASVRMLFSLKKFVGTEHQQHIPSSSPRGRQVRARKKRASKACPDNIQKRTQNSKIRERCDNDAPRTRRTVAHLVQLSRHPHSSSLRCSDPNKESNTRRRD